MRRGPPYLPEALKLSPEPEEASAIRAAMVRCQ